VSKSDEQVLVIPTAVFHAAGLFQGLCRDVEHYLPRLLDPAHFAFLPRSRAEDDPSFKQLIPYVVLKYRDQVFHYTRGQGGGEKRLRALRSVGIGGTSIRAITRRVSIRIGRGCCGRLPKRSSSTRPIRKLASVSSTTTRRRSARCIWASCTSSSWRSQKCNGARLI
jgi:hypothetical protein